MDEPTRDSAGDRHSTGFTRWFLLTGDRLVVSLVILLGIGAAFVVAGVLGIVTVTTPSRVMWYLNGTVNGLLTLVPIAVGVNQIVLSHEFGSIQDLYERRTDITEFRERVEERTDTTVSSPYASTFFGTLLSSISDAATALQDGAGRQTNDPASSELESLAGSIAEQADRWNDKVSADGTSMLQTLVIMLRYDNTRHFHEVRRLKKELGDGDSERTEQLQQVKELFVEIDAARQFLKTMVVERQLARLSRLLVYTGIPAVAVAAICIFAYRDVAGLTVPHSLLVVIAAVIIVTTLVPLAILGAYILRVATIARQTASYGPFIPESNE